MFLALKEKLFGNRSRGDQSASKALARSRLHFVLVQDRTGLTAEEMSGFKREMISVIEKYFVIDKSGFDIAYKRETETTTLLINSPVVVRRRSDLSRSRKEKTMAVETPAEIEGAETSAAESSEAPLVAQT